MINLLIYKKFSFKRLTAIKKPIYIDLMGFLLKRLLYNIITKKYNLSSLMILIK